VGVAWQRVACTFRGDANCRGVARVGRSIRQVEGLSRRVPNSNGVVAVDEFRRSMRARHFASCVGGGSSCIGRGQGR